MISNGNQCCRRKISIKGLDYYIPCSHEKPKCNLLVFVLAWNAYYLFCCTKKSKTQHPKSVAPEMGKCR